MKKKLIIGLMCFLTVSCFAEYTVSQQMYDFLSAELLSMEACYTLLMEESKKLEDSLPALREQFVKEPLEESRRKVQEYKPTAEWIRKSLDQMDGEFHKLIERLELAQTKHANTELWYVIGDDIKMLRGLVTSSNYQQTYKEVLNSSADIQPNDNIYLRSIILFNTFRKNAEEIRNTYLKNVPHIQYVVEHKLDKEHQEKIKVLYREKLKNLTRGKYLNTVEETIKEMEELLAEWKERQEKFRGLINDKIFLQKEYEELGEKHKLLKVKYAPQDNDEKGVLWNKGVGNLKLGYYDTAIDCFSRLLARVKPEEANDKLTYTSCIAMIKAMRDKKENASLIIMEIPEEAKQFGFVCGDFIVSINKLPVRSFNQFRQYREIFSEKSVTFVILRHSGDGTFKKMSLKFDKFPRGYAMMELVEE